MEYPNTVPQGEGGEEIRGFASDVAGENVSLISGISLGVSAQQDVSMNRSVTIGAAAGGDMSLTDSFAMSAAVGGDLRMTDAAAGLLNVSGGAQIEEGGALLTVCREVAARNSNLSVVIAEQVHLEEGSQVAMHMTRGQAILFGVAAGAAFALVRSIFRRK